MASHSRIRDEGKLTQLLNAVSEDLTSLQPRCESTKYAVERQVQRLRKRARFFKPNLRDEAIAKFVKINNSLDGFVANLDPDVEANARHFLTVVLERFTSRQDESLIQVTLDYHFLFDNWRFGPGASNGTKGTHTVDKISQVMTCTDLCEPLVRKLRSANPYFSAFDGHSGSCGVAVVSGSRLTTVPKNEDTERTIAIEPSGSMALQLAAGRYLEGTLSMIGLNIQHQQPINKAMAQRGSIDGSLSTIDLSSASDMISIDLVRRLMPLDWFLLLMRLRSPVIELPDKEVCRLNMISTMGNGFTFPLMTLLIVALIYGFRCQRGGPTLFVDWTNTAVFGDDIIVPTSEFADFCDVLASAGLVVNYDKSYCDGPFRESCGGDYYLGVDVTPFYMRSLCDITEVYVVANQMLDWMGRHFTVLPSALRLVKQLLGPKAFLVPEWMNPDQGIRTAQCSHRFSYLSLVPLRKKHDESIFTMPLAIGGYLSASGSDFVYSPRSVRKKVKVRHGRLPKGYLSGWDPLLRSPPQSAHSSFLAELYFR